MTHIEIRQKFLDFFKERGHTIVPSSSLLPSDPSVLFTTAGMQQFKPYYTGESDPMKYFNSLNTASIQKCIRTSDIDEVGDESHLTFFEMLGNFSFGGYFKKEAIQYAYDFITQEMSLKIDYVSVFGGEPFDSTQGKSGGIPPDLESEKLWKIIDPNIMIKKFGRADNFWGPTGEEGPCGPTTEIYINGIEVWNIVFNQYYQKKDKILQPLKFLGIDTGMGLERLAMVVQKKKNIFETDLFTIITNILPADLNERTKRIITDHLRSISFLISDGVRPSNKDQGYVLRKLARRFIVHSHGKVDFINMFNAITDAYESTYQDLNIELVKSVFDEENTKFQKTLSKGLKELEKLTLFDAINTFKIYESYGLPYEVIKELGGNKAKDLNRDDFDEEFKRHQEKSRQGVEKKFGGHGLILDTGELKAANENEVKIVTRLHTATHLLHTALRRILGDQVHQAGSDITAERLRFDFTFERKLTNEEIKKIEDLVNDVISKDLKVTKEEMPYEEAIKTGALSFFKLKYPNRVNIYTIGPEPVEGQNSSASTALPFSRELCGGPHITHTGEIGHFKIIKEEAVSAGVRRIRAVINLR